MLHRDLQCYESVLEGSVGSSVVELGSEVEGEGRIVSLHLHVTYKWNRRRSGEELKL